MSPKKSLRDIGRKHAAKKARERERAAWDAGRRFRHDGQCESGVERGPCRCDERAWARYDRSMEGDR